MNGQKSDYSKTAKAIRHRAAAQQSEGYLRQDGALNRRVACGFCGDSHVSRASHTAIPRPKPAAFPVPFSQYQYLRCLS